MGNDVDRMLAEYENASDREPMHGKTGEIRRNPSTDQKKARRRQEETRLLRTAATASTLDEQRQAMVELETLRTEAMREDDEERALDITAARIDDTLIPGHVHELHTAATDWLLEIPEHTATRQDAEHALIAEAVLWYGRVDSVIKADGEEFAEQARNKARHVASQYGEHAESAAQAFLTEASRLLEQEVRTGTLSHTAALMDVHDLGDPEGGMVSHDVPETPAETAEPQARPVHAPELESPKVDRPAWAHHLQGDTSGLEEMSHNFAQHVLGKASALSREPERFPEHVGVGGPPISAQDASASPGVYPPEPDTSSNRAPALQEMQNYEGFEGTSVVPDPSGQSEQMNGDQRASEDYARPQAGFPVSGSHTQKESSVTDHAQCPTCGGLGRVAVRKQAYSGLPQVDQIVNADESPGATPLPTDVAWPIVWDPNEINRAIQETEGQIARRPEGLPGPPGAPGHKGASRHEAQGRDNSGWIGDMGAKGPDYPGYSYPAGYDGSNNLGQPDPVYGYGGDEPQGPKLPYGNAEADDFTNNPGEPYNPSVPHNNDQGFQEVAPGFATAPPGGSTSAPGSVGSSRQSALADPFIAAAQEEIARQQQLIQTRSSMLARQGS
jgi:hypothetical protein